MDAFVSFCRAFIAKQYTGRDELVSTWGVVVSSQNAYDVFETAWGWLAVAGSPKGIRATSLPASSPQRAVQEMQVHLRRAELPRVAGLFDDYRRQVDRYLDGATANWDVPLDLEDATEFFRRAWAACRSIPRGETRSYAWLAAEAGRPGAARAAGQAMARNRVPLVIPCHRVVGSDGSLHGFGGGLPMKARLLAMEGGVPTPPAKLVPGSHPEARERAGARW